MHVKKSQNPIKYVILTALLAAYIFPFFMVLINAFKEKVDVIKNPLSLLGERGFILSNFPAAMEKMNFFRASGNSLLITGVSVVLIVLFSAMAAYIMARENWLVCRVFFFFAYSVSCNPFSGAYDSACFHIRRNVRNPESPADTDFYACGFWCGNELVFVLRCIFLGSGTFTGSFGFDDYSGSSVISSAAEIHY